MFHVKQNGPSEEGPQRLAGKIWPGRYPARQAGRIVIRLK